MPRAPKSASEPTAPEPTAPQGSATERSAPARSAAQLRAARARTATATPTVAPAHSKPRWLNDDEQQVWRAFLAASQLLCDRLDQELQRDAGIPHTYYEVLVALSESPERRMRMSALADRSLSSRSRLSHAVARLEEVGWVRRENCCCQAW